MATSLTANDQYWAYRGKLEREWQNQNLKDDAAYAKVISEYYEQAAKAIQGAINDQYTKYAGKEGYTYADAKKAVSAADMAAFQKEAAQVVSDAKKIFAQNGKVTYKDFSQEVNEHMRLYNATMRINRLEYLKAQIGLELVRTGVNVGVSMSDKVTQDYLDEVKRQSGLLGDYSPPAEFTDYKHAFKQVMGMQSNGRFSDTLWKNQDALKANLDIGLTNMLVQGWGARKMAVELRKFVSDSTTNARYAAERLARTESARLQDKAAEDCFRDQGVKKVQWFAEPKACSTCAAIAEAHGGIYDIDDAPSIPAHPNCRCSKAAVPDRTEGDRLTELYRKEAGLDVREEPEADATSKNSPKRLMEQVTRGKPMSVEKADHNNANPNFDGPPETRANTKAKRLAFYAIKDQYDELGKQVEKARKAMARSSDPAKETAYLRLIEKRDELVDPYNAALGEWKRARTGTEPYQRNCQRCAPTYELRRRGYDVEALANNGGSTHDVYRIPAEMWRNEDGSISRPQRLPTKTNSGVTLALMNQMKPGERGTIDWGWARSNVGHIINVERTEDGILFIDAQPGRIVKTFEEYMGDNKFRQTLNGMPYGVRYNRTDDKFIDLENIAKIVRKAEEG